MTTSQMALFSNNGGDPFFSSVTLLMEANPGGIVDLSLNAYTVTANNGAALSSTQSMFGGQSFSFLNGGSNNGSFTFSGAGAPLLLGAGDFTLEMWCYTATGGDLLASKTSVGATVALWSVDGSRALTLGKQGIIRVVTSAVGVPPNQWNHIALTRASGTVRQFINGVLDATTAADATTWTADATAVIGTSVGGNNNSAFYMDQIRITVGVARYTVTFSVPSAPFPTN